jgi:hypothetical protein
MTKKEINNLSGLLQEAWGNDNKPTVFSKLEQVVSSKIKFPALEHLAILVNDWLPTSEVPSFIEKVVAMDQIGSYPFCGKLIQLQLENDLLGSFRLAAKSIHAGDVWYACDTISERVYGMGLLHFWEEAFPLVKKLSSSKNHWDRRGVGVATHLTVKWGLDPKRSADLLELALKRQAATHHEEKTGIGWGLKTIAKFHPELLKGKGMETGAGLPAWMASKIKRGMALAALRATKLRQKER